MLRFDRMVSLAAIDKIAVYTNTHGANSIVLFVNLAHKGSEVERSQGDSGKLMALRYESSYLAPENWAFSIDWLPQFTYLVGGTVRDALLDRQRDSFDLDFVLPNQAIETARRIARHCQAGFVVLDAERQIARVVFEDGTADFAQQEGNCLEVDLQRRDFTINAIAYDPRTQTLIDPLQGLKDLDKGLLRMVSKANLKDDPLRLLRAYRQAAQLDFRIARRTRSTLRQLASLLRHVAAERVQAELGYLLVSTRGGRWLKAAWKDGLLALWFPDAKAENLLQVQQVEQCAWLLGKIWVELDKQLQGIVADRALSWIGLAKLACLVSPTPKVATSQLEALKYSRLEVRAVTTALKYLPRLLQAGTSPMSLREQYFFFQEVGRVFPLLMVLAVTVAAQQDILRETQAVGAIAPFINRYIDPDDPVAHPTPLLNGNELMRSLQLSPSPLIGRLLTEIQVARIEGKLATVAEALHFAATLVDSA